MREKVNKDAYSRVGFSRDILFTISYFGKKRKLAAIIGSIILAIGIVGTFYYGSINVTQIVNRNVNPQNGLPYPVNGVPPASAQVAFEILLFVGLLILAYGIATRYTDLTSRGSK
jgi:TRAP-type C4-dicarboxylate transport system permease small subunit